MKLEVTERDNKINYSTKIEVGDYLPYFYINHDDRKLDIQVKASVFNVLVFVSVSSGLDADNLKKILQVKTGYSTYFISEEDLGYKHESLFFDNRVYNLFANEIDVFTVCLSDKNLKVVYMASGRDLSELLVNIPPQSSFEASRVPPPVLIVPNVISEFLAEKLISYIEKNKNDAHQDSSGYKSRSHVFPARSLEYELDNKLCKSLLPEIQKVFFTDVSHRETYKICCYNSNDRGCFGKHRDTIDPYLHRRYAMSLMLNDDYEGGGICFPEYCDEVVKVPKYSAVVFPGSLYHQVKAIDKGKRYVIISFLFSDAEARLKPCSERFRFMVNRDICGIKINKLTPHN